MKFTQKKYYYPGSDRTVYNLIWDPQHDVDDYSEIENWCYEQFGKAGYRDDTEDTRWINNIPTGEVMFLKEEDLVLFKLRWE